MEVGAEGARAILDEATLDQLMSLPEMASVMSLDGTMLWTDPRGADTLGYTRDELLGMHAPALLHPNDMQMAELAIAIGLVRPDGFFPVPLRYLHKDGHQLVFEIFARMGELRRLDGTIEPVIIATSRDLHVRSEIEMVMRSIAGGEPVDETLARIVRLASPPLAGWSASLVTADPDAPTADAPALRFYPGELPSGLVDPARYGDEVPVWDRAASTGEPVIVSVDELPEAVRAIAVEAGLEAVLAQPIVHPGSDRPAVLVIWADLAVSVHALPYWLESQVIPVLGIALEQQRARAELEWAAGHDSLTGLANRAQLFDTLTRSIARCRNGDRVGVLYLDLDRFKAVNDTFGHDTGDHVLVETAARFTAAVRPHDLVGRLGGDEFAVVCPDCTDLEQVQALGERLVAALREPFAVNGGLATIGTSAGAVLAGPDATADLALKQADAALYRAKRGGGGAVVVALT